MAIKLRMPRLVLEVTNMKTMSRWRTGCTGNALLLLKLREHGLPAPEPIHEPSPVAGAKAPFEMGPHKLS
eukprot:4053129-Amphidinium_carterae.1